MPETNPRISSSESPRSTRWSKIRPIVVVGALVLAARVLAEVDALEHERAERQHRRADVVALDDVAGALGALDQVVDERVDPRRAGLAEQLELGARQVVRRRAARSGSRRRCRG